jgi:hypothetical protein
MTMSQILISAPDRAIGRKIGNRLSSFIDERRISLAEETIKVRGPAHRAYVMMHLTELEVVIRTAPADQAERVFEHVHEIRSIAANGGLEALGIICDILCTYLEAIDGIAAPDPNYVSQAIVAARFATSPGHREQREAQSLIDMLRHAGRELAARAL